MSSSIGPDSGIRIYPNLLATQSRLLPDKTEKLTAFFNRTAGGAENLSQNPPAELTQEQRKIKWLDERFKTIDKIFQGTHGGSQPSDDDKRELLNKLSEDACEPAFVSICESFIATAGDVKADQVVNHVIRELKRAIIQEIITSNPFVRQKFIHTINAMNLFIIERFQDLGISKEDSLYLDASKDIHTRGVRGVISDSLGEDYVASFLDALVEKFSTTYTKKAIVGIASDWINKPERLPLRKELAPLLRIKLESTHDDPIRYVVEHCIKDMENTYEFTDKGIEGLLDDEIKAMSETFSGIKKRVEENGVLLEGLSAKWKADPRIVRAAVSQESQAFQYAARDVQLLLIKENPALLAFASPDLSHELYNNKDLLLAVIKENPGIIPFLPEAIKLDKAFILTVMEQNPKAICFVPEVIINDKELKLSLVEAFAFGEKKWEKYFGSVGEVPPLPANIIETLRSPCPYFKDKKVGETHLLMLVPATVDGQPFNLENLDKLVKNPKQPGHALKNNCFNGVVKDKYGKDTPKASQWVLMTNDVIPDSRKKSYSDQKALVENVPGYKVPDLLSAAACIMMNFVDRNECLFPNDPLTYTRCKEVLNGYQIVVGALAPSGLSIHSINFDAADNGMASLLPLGPAEVL